MNKDRVHAKEEDHPISGARGASVRRSASEPPRPDCFGEDHLKTELLRRCPHLPHLNLESPSVLDSESYPFSTESTIIDEVKSSSEPKAPPVRGHRRRSTQVTRASLDKFRKEVLGVEDQWYEEEGSTTPTNPFDPEFEDLNRAFDAASMSLNSGNGAPSPGAGMFSSYGDNQGSSSMPGTPRQSMSSPMPHTPGQMNGGGMPGMNGGMPMNAGQQMDLNHLYSMVLELSDVLKNNREVTKSIVTSAEEIMVCLLPLPSNSRSIRLCSV